MHLACRACKLEQPSSGVKLAGRRSSLPTLHAQLTLRHVLHDPALHDWHIDAYHADNSRDGSSSMSCHSVRKSQFYKLL